MASHVIPATHAVRFVKVNVDEEPRLAEAHGVSSIPTLVFFHHGRDVGRILGAVPRSTLSDAIESVQAAPRRGPTPRA